MNNYNINNIKYAIEDNLYNYLITNLPLKICGFNSKTSFNLRLEQYSEKALNNCKWIEYNQKWVNQLIIDLDYNISINDAINKCIEMSIEPTWICKTDKGVHISFGLNNKINYEWDKTIQYVRNIKEALTYFLGGDILGSHRLKGIWRNPLKHDFSYGLIKYDLNDFKHILLDYREINKTNQQKYDTKKTIIKIKNNCFKYELGNRNNYLFYNLMIASKNKGLTFEKTLQMLNHIHNEVSNVENRLDVKSLNSIAKSVYKYNTNNKNFISAIDLKNRGAMGFTPIASNGYVDNETHKRITKERQKAAAIYTHNLEGQQMLRQQNMIKVNEEQKAKSNRLITSCLSGLFKEEYKKPNGKWNLTKLANDTGLHRNTISMHIRNLSSLTI